MVAPSSSSSSFNAVLTTDLLSLNVDGKASSDDVVTTFKSENLALGYDAEHNRQSSVGLELCASNKLPQKLQKINEPTADMFIDGKV